MIMSLRSVLPYCVLFLANMVSAQTYITNVNIGDVENQRWIPYQTVVIEDGLISKVQSADKFKVPAGMNVIDGSGKFLLPGLIDAHIHFSQSGGLYTRPDAIDLRTFLPYQKEIDRGHQQMEQVLRRYLQNGITTVIDVGTTVNYLKQRAAFMDAAFAPAIYMSGPLITTYEPPALSNLGDDGPFNLVTSPEDGRKMVQQQLKYHPDFIKIWYIVGRDTSDIEISARAYLPIITAIIEEAHKNNIKMAVHATQRITAQLAVESGCDYLVHSVDDEILSDDFIQLLKKKKTILCPTLVVHDGYVNTFGQHVEMSNHELEMGDPYQLGSLMDMKHIPDTALVERYTNHMNTDERIEEVRQTTSNMMVNLKRLSDAGVIIVTGTDAGNIGTLHASSYLTEMQAMKESGMTNWQILQASTLNGARVLGREKEFGTIEKGKKANLILLDADPSLELDNVARINLVINKGVVIDPDTLIRESATDLVQRQLNAYNLRNIEAFLATYTDDAVIYTFPEKVLYQGKEQIRQAYTTLFENTPDLHCEILVRTVNDNVVIDEERALFNGKLVVATAMYHVEGNKIQKVYFME